MMGLLDGGPANTNDPSRFFIFDSFTHQVLILFTPTSGFEVYKSKMSHKCGTKDLEDSEKNRVQHDEKTKGVAERNDPQQKESKSL